MKVNSTLCQFFRCASKHFSPSIDSTERALHCLVSLILQVKGTILYAFEESSSVFTGFSFAQERSSHHWQRKTYCSALSFLNLSQDSSRIPMYMVTQTPPVLSLLSISHSNIMQQCPLPLRPLQLRCLGDLSRGVHHRYVSMVPS